MVATTDEMFKPEKNRSRADLWVLAALSGIALVCVSLLAVALALILGKGSLIQVNPVFNSPGTGAGSATAPGAAPQQPEAPAVDRGWASQGLPSALPVVPPAPVLVPTAVPILAQPAPVLRAEANTPMERVPVPVESVPAPESGDVFQVRGEAPSFYTGDQALPMPVHHIPGYDSSASRAQASSAPQSVAAARPAPTALDTPAAPAAVAVAPAAGGPGVYAKVGCQGALVNLRLESARSAASLPGFSASQGNLFFTARVLIHNKGAAPLAVDSDAFDLRDADGDSYMAMPGAASPAPLAAGARSTLTVTFLIPDDVALRSLSLVLPSEKDLLPLSQP